MRTPIHVRTTARVEAPAIVLSDDAREIIVRDLIVSAGPKDDAGRLVRVFLSRKQAQGLAAQLDALLAE